jgi:hypothetical protein
MAIQLGQVICTKFFVNANSVPTIFAIKPKETYSRKIFIFLEWKFLITILLILALTFGILLRSIIINYLKSPDSKGPVNCLILVDQVLICSRLFHKDRPL